MKGSVTHMPPCPLLIRCLFCPLTPLGMAQSWSHSVQRRWYSVHQRGSIREAWLAFANWVFSSAPTLRPRLSPPLPPSVQPYSHDSTLEWLWYPRTCACNEGRCWGWGAGSCGSSSTNTEWEVCKCCSVPARGSQKLQPGCQALRNLLNCWGRLIYVINNW